jgi:cytochrome c2
MPHFMPARSSRLRRCGSGARARRPHPVSKSKSRERRTKIGGFGLASIAVLATAAVLWGISTSRDDAIATALTGGDPSQAPALIRRYGCGGCHTISALPGAYGKVAAPLDQLRKRFFIGGVTLNSPDNLVHWIVSPRAFSPQTAMPATGISEAEPRHIESVYQGFGVAPM